MYRHLFLLLTLAACTKAAETDDTDTTDTDDTDVTPLTCAETTETGSIVVSVSMLADLIPSMEEAPVGLFHGSVFRGEEVTGAGPVDGAVSIADFTSVSIDLSGGGPVDAGVTLDAIPACTVAILGCLDSDANDCDKKDPITLPNNNRFPIASGATPTAVTVYLGLLNPS